jgi:DNA-binding response OmpR family regulator
LTFPDIKMSAFFFSKSFPQPEVFWKVAALINQEGTIQSAFADFHHSLTSDPEAVGVVFAVGTSEPLSICLNFRNENVTNPLIFIFPDAERGAEQRTIVPLLMAGADDVQPVSIDPLELAERIAAVARRDRGADQTEVYEFGNCVFDFHKQTIQSDGLIVAVTGHESKVLREICNQRGGLALRTSIMNSLYRDIDAPEIKIVDVFVCKIRSKIRALGAPGSLIETEWGKGYRLNSNAAVEA